jgi:hypothetical protein
MNERFPRAHDAAWGSALISHTLPVFRMAGELRIRAILRTVPPMNQGPLRDKGLRHEIAGYCY